MIQKRYRFVVFIMHTSIACIPVDALGHGRPHVRTAAAVSYAGPRPHLPAVQPHRHAGDPQTTHLLCIMTQNMLIIVHWIYN